MTRTPEFRGAVHQNLYLAEGGREVHAVITVDAEGDTAAQHAPPQAAEVVRLRLWTPVGATVRFVIQTAPTLVDLSPHRIDSGPLTGDYPTGSWGTESRDYLLGIELEPGDVGEEKLACRVTFVPANADGTELPLRQTFSHTEPDGATSEFSSARIRALWTDDRTQSTVINDKVAEVTGRAELAKAVQDGVAVHHGGDPDQIYDPDTGTFRLNRMSAQEEMGLDIESTKTTLLGRR